MSDSILFSAIINATTYSYTSMKNVVSAKKDATEGRCAEECRAEACQVRRETAE
jgi:hypothetical protein